MEAYQILLLTLGILFSPLIIFALLVLGSIRFNIPLNQLIKKYANHESKFLDMDGMRVHYRDTGQGPVLILIHGTIESAHAWDEWSQELNDSFRVIRMDIPGFGLTGPNKEKSYKIENYHQFLDKFVEKLGIKEFYLGGNSLGGFIAWSYAVAYPDKVKKLVLVGPAGYPPGANLITAKIANTPLLNKVLYFATPKFGVKIALKKAYGNHDKITPNLLNQHYELTLRKGNRPALVSMFQTLERDWVHEKLKHLKVPTLILWGKKDRILFSEKAAKFNQDIPNSKLKIYEEAGHMVIKEIPVKSSRDAKAFLLS